MYTFRPFAARLHALSELTHRPWNSKQSEQIQALSFAVYILSTNNTKDTRTSLPFVRKSLCRFSVNAFTYSQPIKK